MAAIIEAGSDFLQSPGPCLCRRGGHRAGGWYNPRMTPNMPAPPIDPMLAKVALTLPEGEGFLFEPKWDGLRALIFRTPDGVVMQGRDHKPLNRYFPELEKALVEQLPKGCILDGEIVVNGAQGLDPVALDKRISMPLSLIGFLARKTPSSFVAFDLLAAGGRSTMDLPLAERRARLERLLGEAQAPLHLTLQTADRAVAADWLARFIGAGLDGVMAKPADTPYRPGKRGHFKVKPEHTADCVVAGFHWHTDRQEAIGSLLLGLYDADGTLQRVGTASTFTVEMRRALVAELAPLRENARENHPWREQAADPEAQGAWQVEKALRWEPLRPERVCEVRYEHLQGPAFREATVFKRWRSDKPARDCGFDQLAVATPAELGQVLTPWR